MVLRSFRNRGVYRALAFNENKIALLHVFVPHLYTLNMSKCPRPCDMSTYVVLVAMGYHPPNHSFLIYTTISTCPFETCLQSPRPW